MHAHTQKTPSRAGGVGSRFQLVELVAASCVGTCLCGAQDCNVFVCLPATGRLYSHSMQTVPARSRQTVPAHSRQTVPVDSRQTVPVHSRQIELVHSSPQQADWACPQQADWASPLQAEAAFVFFSSSTY